MRTDAASTTLAIYTRQSGSWQGFTSGLIATVSETTRTVSSNYTVDASGADYEIYTNQSAAISITLPAPAQGRAIIITDLSGTAQTNNITIVRHGSENINGVAASRVCQTNFGSWRVVSPDGTNWEIN